MKTNPNGTANSAAHGKRKGKFLYLSWLGDRTGRFSAALLIIFLLTLPLVNPWVRGDGVGYYAYLRSLLIEHRLDFANDWRAGNESFTMGRIGQGGSIVRSQFTRTGHLDNHFAVGASILWAPFIVPVHGVVLVARDLGAKVNANGFSRPYLITLALATALYGFLGLMLCFRLTSLYCGERWAFLATVGIWLGSSLPVYMYFNPSWSHAHSLFVVSVFLWYWHRTRHHRTLTQWVILGLWSGLMLDVYYLNIAVLVLPLMESLRQYAKGWQSPDRRWVSLGRLFNANVVYCIAVVAAFLPTLISRNVIYGSPLDMGYSHEWRWPPALLQVLFSSDHGLLAWTPIIIPAIMGLFLLRKYERELASDLLVSFLAFYLLVSLHTHWDGLSSFGNRFFISLDPYFILGLAVFFKESAKMLKNLHTAYAWIVSATVFLVIWNLAFIFQWGTHMVPVRGPISWKQMVRNQFVAVPRQSIFKLPVYFANRAGLMHQIEEEDVRQIRRREGATQAP